MVIIENGNTHTDFSTIDLSSPLLCDFTSIILYS
jgi:hypothetical protein